MGDAVFRKLKWAKRVNQLEIGECGARRWPLAPHLTIQPFNLFKRFP
jgi:hypothetical protein